MAILPWRTRRQLLYFGIFSLVVLVVIAGVGWYFWPRSICLDAKNNCGGPCTPCLGELKDLSVSWVRFFKNRENFYDVAALVENPNLNAGLPNITYMFKLYDANNIEITAKDGVTFINPGDKRMIFESNLNTGSRIPSHIYIEFANEKNWKYIKKEKSFLSVVNKNFINYPFPRLTAEIRNDSLFDAKNVFVSSVLYDEKGNAIGISSTKIDLIPSESSGFASFTWPQPFEKEPAATEIFPTTNLMVNSNQ